MVFFTESSKNVGGPPVRVPDDLIDRLGLNHPTDPDRLRRLPPAPEVSLPDDSVMQTLMSRCGIDESDQRDLLLARPDPVRDPDWWSLLRGVTAELRSGMDRPLAAQGYTSWPTVPEDAGPVGLWLYAWALFSVVPDLVAAHARRGVPEAVTSRTLRAMGGVVGAHLEVTGVRGVGLFPLWGPPQVITGRDLSIGRLDFTRAELAVGDGPAAWVLQVHIPPRGPLDPDECAASVEEALVFFAAHYPDEPLSALVCKSWILDPQLADYLDPRSNLLTFQRGWTLLPRVPLDDPDEGDREMMRLGLQLPVPDRGPLAEADLARVPTDTSLQRAFVTHLRSGQHWHKRTGIRWLGQPPEPQSPDARVGRPR